MRARPSRLRPTTDGDRPAGRRARGAPVKPGHLFVRHPPLTGMDGICYGRLDAEPAPEAMDIAVRVVAPTLPCWPVHSSPSRRCLHFATRLAAGIGRPVHIDPRLQELDFGRWEGHRWADLPRDALDAWAIDIDGFAPPGGESFVQLRARVAAALADAPVPCILIAHAGVLRAALHLQGMPSARVLAASIAHAAPVWMPAPTDAAIPLRS